MSLTDPYPSLQTDRSYTAEEAVPVMDAMVLRLRYAERALARAADALGALPVRRAGRHARARLVIDLECEQGKTRDTLAVYGFRDQGLRTSYERRG